MPPVISGRDPQVNGSQIKIRVGLQVDLNPDNSAGPVQLRKLSQLALSRSVSIATAESCTGGGIAKALTELPGSSNWFEAGLVTYSNQAKMMLLGVKDETLELHGAVSEAVVREMVAGALRQTGADLAVAVSGIAGPDGGSESKPVGTVWIAWQLREWQAEARLFKFEGDRAAVREAAIDAAVNGLIDQLQKFSS